MYTATSDNKTGKVQLLKPVNTQRTLRLKLSLNGEVVGITKPFKRPATWKPALVDAQGQRYSEQLLGRKSLKSSPKLLLPAPEAKAQTVVKTKARRISPSKLFTKKPTQLTSFG